MPSRSPNSMLGWMGEVAFCAEVLAEGASLFWLPILKNLAGATSIPASEIIRSTGLSERVGARAVADLRASGLVAFSLEAAAECVTLTERGKQVVQQLSHAQERFIKQLAEWLGPHVGTQRATKATVKHFLRLVADWAEEDARAFLAPNRRMQATAVEALVHPPQSTHDPSEKNLRDIVHRIRIGDLRGEVPELLMLHSFVYWVIQQSLFDNPGKRLAQLVRNRRRIVAVDTSVLVGATVHSDSWHTATKGLITGLRRVGTGASPPTSLVLLESTIAEFTYAIRKIGIRVALATWSPSRSEFRSRFAESMKYGMFREFFAQTLAFGGSYDNYRQMLLKRLGDFIDDNTVTVCPMSEIVTEYDSLFDKLPDLRSLEHTLRGYSDDNRIAHKVSLLAWVARERAMDPEALPIIWSYYHAFPEYERICLGGHFHAMDLLHVRALLEADRLFEQGDIGVLRGIVQDYRSEGVILEDLEAARTRAEWYWAQHFDRQAGRLVSGPAPQLHTGLLYEMQTILQKMIDGERAESTWRNGLAHVWRDGLDHVFDPNEQVGPP